MADEKAMRVPSGDQRGRLSGPGLGDQRPDRRVGHRDDRDVGRCRCSTGSPLTVWSKAMALPSGDQSKPPTVKSPFVRRFVFFDSTSITQRCERRWSSSTSSNSPYFLSRSFHASGFGSVMVKAICLPSGDQAKEPTPSSSRVSCSASPNDGRMSQICCLSDRSDVKAMRATRRAPSAAIRSTSCRWSAGGSCPPRRRQSRSPFRRRSHPSSPRAPCRPRAVPSGEMAGAPTRLSAMS